MQVFTESTHIVAIKTSGNVYAYEAVQELNIKPKFMKDLLTDQPFTRKDIIHIQDPMNLEASMSVSPHVAPTPLLPPSPAPCLWFLPNLVKPWVVLAYQGHPVSDCDISCWPRPSAQSCFLLCRQL